MERAFHVGPPGRWWNNPQYAGQLGLTTDQQKRMEAVFEQNRGKLLDQMSALQKEESSMGPLLAADQPDENRVLAQIDRIAQARAELEKANARMLLDMRRVLSQDQWKKLRAEDAAHHPRFGSWTPPGNDANRDSGHD
jgi:Spy/CpxP family protein refolding chaperone